jgi:hypothetical protein
MKVLERIEIFDERFYFIKTKSVPKELEYLRVEGGVYLPSVTHILDVAYSKGKMFEEWLKGVGNNAKVIAGIAAERGTRGHHACELLLAGEELDCEMYVEGDHKYLPPKYSLEEWKNILKFKEFYDLAQPEDIVSEGKLYNLELGYAGTADIICTINGERWLIDIKFGNSIYESHFLQLEAYARCVDVDRMGVLHMQASTRGADKKGKTLQGRGWRLEEPKVDREMLFNTWKAVLQIYKYKNNGETPKSLTYPKKIKLWD